MGFAFPSGNALIRCGGGNALIRCGGPKIRKSYVEVLVLPIIGHLFT